jgi:hypothetical protein
MLGREVGGIRHHHDLLAPRRGPECWKHLAKQGVFGCMVGIVLAAHQGAIHGDTTDAPLRHQEHDATAEDVRMVLAEARLLGHWMLWPSLALERPIAHHRQDTALGWGQHLQGLVGEPPQQRLCAPVGGAQQTAILLVGQMRGAMPGQRLQIGPFAIQEVHHQEPAEGQLVPMAAAGPQDPQELRDAAGQTGQGHGPSLLGEARSDGPSRSSILGSAWTVKDFHA